MDSIKPLNKFIRHLPTLIWLTFVAFAQFFIPRKWYAKDVSEDIVLITGAGSGLGRQIALEYAALNSNLVLWDINGEGLQETKELVESAYKDVAKRLKESSKLVTKTSERICRTYIADVSDREQVYAKAREVHRDLNKGVDLAQEKERYVSILINNAGIYHGHFLSDLRDDQIERIFKINIIAHFWTVRAFLPKMIENERGHIVEIASMGGISGLLKQVDYCATKFAAVGFEESLSIELDHLGLGDKIFTTAICPLFFRSNLFTGYDAKAFPIMSCNFVARETVLSMRCNHSRVLLPFNAYLLNLLRPITPRRALFLWTRILGMDDGIKTIRGAAAAVGAS